MMFYRRWIRVQLKCLLQMCCDRILQGQDYETINSHAGSVPANMSAVAVTHTMSIMSAVAWSAGIRPECACLHVVR